MRVNQTKRWLITIMSIERRRGPRLYKDYALSKTIFCAYNNCDPKYTFVVNLVTVYFVLWTLLELKYCKDFYLCIKNC